MTTILIVEDDRATTGLLKTVFEMEPADFAAGIAECLHAGASLVGGCCGTTPEHIRAVVNLIGKK